MKVLSWFGKWFSVAVLVSLLSVFTTAYLVDQYVKVLLDRWNIPGIERPSLKLGDLFSAMTSPDKIGLVDQDPDIASPSSAISGQSDDPWKLDWNKDNEQQIGPDDAVKASGTPTAEEGTNDSASGNVNQNGSSSDNEAVPVFGQAKESRLIVMSAQEFNEKRKKLSDSDKMEIFTILIQKLPQQELQRMSEMLENGITEEDLKELEDVINAYLHKDEVDRLLLILNKY